MITTTIIAIAIILFLLLLLHQLLDSNKHLILQLLMFVFILPVALILVPKAAIDSQTVCEPVIDFTNTVGGFHYYNYTTYCYDRPETTAQTLFTVSNVMFYLVVGYLIVYLAFWGLKKLIDSTKTKGGGR